MDIELRRKQSFWETPRNIAVIIAAAVAVAAAISGWAGYSAGRASQPIIIQVPAPAGK